MSALRKTTATICIASLCLLAGMPASAQHRGGHGGGYGGGYSHGYSHGGGPRVGIYIRPPVYAPYYHSPPRYYYPRPPVVYAPQLIYAPPVGYPPAVVYSTPAAPPVYVERNDLPPAPLASAPAVPPPADWWYFCADSGTYYPYVTQCASPWERVSPQPPGASR